MNTAFLLLAQGGEQPAEGGKEPEKVVDLITNAKIFLTQQGLDFASNFVMNLIAAAAIFYIGRWIARIIVRVCRSLMAKANVDETLISFITNIVYWALTVVVILAALEQLGVDTTSVAAVMAAAGLAVGLALQDSLSNFASGVMLILFKPFKLGDFIDAGGVKGVVESIQIFNTVLRTPDNVQIIVPNRDISGGSITNFSAKDTRRVDLVIGCGYSDDLRQVKEFLEQTLAGDDRILDEPAPIVAVDELGSSSVNFVVRPWVKSADYWDVKWELIESIKLGFDDRGFNFPFPSRDVYMHQEAS